jgi:hypothetical protein
MARNPKIRRKSVSTGSSISEPLPRKIKADPYTYTSRRYNNSGSLAIFAAIRRASMCVSVFRFEERSTKLFDEGASRR